MVANPLTISYYADGAHNYADVVIWVNGIMGYGECEMRVAKDGRSILFVCAIRARSFDKKIVKIIMKDDYRESCARVIAWDNMAQEMETKKVHSKNGLFWGKPQVAWLKWKCTGMPNAVNKHNYLTEYRVCDKHGKWCTQCNCIIIITVQSAKNIVKVE